MSNLGEDWRPYESYEHYRELTRAVRLAARARGQKLLTNSFLMPARAQKLIVAQRLFYQQRTGNLFELELAETFGLLSFAVSDEAEVEGLAVPAATKAVWPFRLTQGTVSQKKLDEPVEPSEQTQQADRILKRLGFESARRLGRMGMDGSAREEPPIKVGSDAASNSARAPFWRVEEAEESDAEPIAALLEASFDPVLAELPSRHALIQAITAGQVLAARQSGSLAGVLVAALEGKNAWIRQLAVAPVFRGQGLGAALVRVQFARFGAAVRQFLLWVDKANATAVDLYTRCGYGFDGHEAIEYLSR